MLSAAAIRCGEKIELRSRDWLAVPETQEEVLNKGEVNETTKERLVFRIKKKVNEKSEEIDDGDNPASRDYGFMKNNETSSTTFVDPSPELIKQFRNIRESVLIFAPRTPLTSTDDVEVLSASSGKLYIRQILIPGNHGLKYTYHLKNFEVENRDRNVISEYEMKTKIREVIENTHDEDFIADFLSNAFTSLKDKDMFNLLEFRTNFEIKSGTSQADKWIEVFQRKYGERTAIRSDDDLDSAAYYQAQHMGIQMITLPRCIANALIGLKGKDGKEIISYEKALADALNNIVPVPWEKLTNEEKQMIAHLKKYNKILGLAGYKEEPIKEIKVYDYPVDYNGDKGLGCARFGDTIQIYRPILKAGIFLAGDIFFHEAGHAMTGADDAEPLFRNFFTMLLSKIAAQVFPLQESVDENRMADDISTSNVVQKLRQLENKINSESKTGEKKDGGSYGR